MSTRAKVSVSSIWLIAGLALAALLAALAWKAERVSPASAPSAIGGPFHLTSQSGTQVDERILKGKWTAVYFGYTSCPDVCPTTLTNLAQAIDALGTRARDLQVVFITVDPERDTPPRLAAYLSIASFPKGVIGLTGTPGEVAAAARAYRVYYRKAGEGAAYSVDHTSVVYLMNPNGEFSRPLSTDGPPAGVANQITDAMSGD
jgi:protein SCO1/2